MAAKKPWRKAYKKATGISAKKGITRVQKSSGASRATARKQVRKSARSIMAGMGAQMKGGVSKKAVNKTTSKVMSRQLKKTGTTSVRAAKQKARSIVRGRKWANS